MARRPKSDEERLREAAELLRNGEHYPPEQQGDMYLERPDAAETLVDMPKPESNGTHQDNGEGGEGGEPPTLPITADDVATIDDLIRAGSEVRWLWPGWIQVGVLTAIAAEGGTGKTRLCADLLRRIRHGLTWPDGEPMAVPRDALALWVVADNHHDEMVTLARDFDIKDSIRINALKSDPYGGVTLETLEDYVNLGQRIRVVQPQLVVIDTVGNATDRNLSKQEDARAFYSPLQVMARRYSCAILCLTHLNATGHFLGRRVLEKVRVALRMAKPDPKDPRRVLEVHKTNSKKPDPLGVKMGDHGNEYDHEPPTAPEGVEPGQMPPATPGVDRCCEWLKEQLIGGSLKVHMLREGAEAEGFSSKTLYAAKQRLQLEEFESQGRKWWRLEGSEHPYS